MVSCQIHPATADGQGGYDNDPVGYGQGNSGQYGQGYTMDPNQLDYEENTEMQMDDANWSTLQDMASDPIQ